jgi:hypothetical protein
MRYHLSPRENKKQKIKVKIRAYLVLFLLSLLFIGTIYIVRESPFFKIKKINVVGLDDREGKELIKEIETKFLGNLAYRFLGKDNFFAWPEEINFSNQEFSSALRSFPFPFQQGTKGSTIEIWHGSHGKFETEAPIHTFVPYKIKGEEFILASYTCTPLVKIPVAALKPGAKVKGALPLPRPPRRRHRPHLLPLQKGRRRVEIKARSGEAARRLDEKK